MPGITGPISSVVALVGIAGAKIGYPIMDPIAGILVSGWIMKTGITIGYDAVKELADTRIEKEVLNSIKNILDRIEEIVHYHEIRARRMGPHILIDLHIEVPQKRSVSASHQISERARRIILKEIPQVSEVLIHVDAEKDIDEDKYELMRPHAEVENDIRQVALKYDEVRDISDIQCHYLDGILSIQLNISVDPRIRVLRAQQIAQKLKQGVEEIHDIQNVDIHLEL